MAVTTKGGAERKARQLGHRLGAWTEAAFVGRDGRKSQCQDCGRQALVLREKAHGDALTERCG